MRLAMLFSLLVFCSSAFATSIQTKVYQVLPLVKIDGQEVDQTGTVLVDIIKNEIKVMLFFDPCESLLPDDGKARCKMAANLLNTYEVPLKERRVSCGSAVYEGSHHMAMVDGLNIDITVVDNTRHICMEYQPYGFAVTVKVFNPWTGKTIVYQMMN